MFPVGGFIGVEMLLFISGFGLFYQYLKKQQEGEPEKTSTFFWHRITRIIPSYYLALFVILVFFQPALGDAREALWKILAHVLFLQNYFDGMAGAINGVLWTLSVEAFFYIIFLPLAWLFVRKSLLTFLLCVTAALTYRIVVSQYAANLSFMLNQLPGFLDLYASGMLAAYLTLRWQTGNITGIMRLLNTLVSVICVSILGGLLYALFVYRFTPAVWQAQNRIFIALLLCVITVTTMYGVQLWQSLVANKLFVFFSVISYNLYIWHQFIAVKLKQAYIPASLYQAPHEDPTWRSGAIALYLVVAITVATAITFLFERPITKWALHRGGQDAETKGQA